MKKLNKKGFTLVELVIVIAVIAILAAVLIPVFSNVISNANKSAALQNAKNEYTAYAVAVAPEAPEANCVIESGSYFFEVENGKLSDNALSSKPDGYGTVDLTAPSSTELEGCNADIKIYAANP